MSVYSRSLVKYTRKSGSWPMLERVGVVSRDRDRSARWELFGGEASCVEEVRQEESFQSEI